jgi:uncharacterized protein
MRQAEREITDLLELESVLRRARVCRLGLNDDGAPYVVPMNFGYADGCLWFHCATAGKKLDLIRRDERVGFEVTTEAEVLPAETACGWETKFMSVIGRGRAGVIGDPAGKRQGLDALMAQHAGPGKVWAYGEGPLSRMVVLKVVIEHMTGKRSKHHIREGKE